MTETYDLTSLKKGLDELEIHLTEEQTGQFLTYYELLTEWNSFMNLTAITEFQEVVTKHFLDSLSIVKAQDMKKVKTLLDAVSYTHLDVYKRQASDRSGNILHRSNVKRRLSGQIQK